MQLIANNGDSMVQRDCPVCGCRDQGDLFAEANFRADALDQFAFASRKMPEYMHYRLVACPTCDLIYASPLPKAGDLFCAYRDAAFDSGQEAHFAARTYGRFLPAIARQLPDLRGTLDIGTGDGAFLEQLLAAGFQDVAGVEPSEAPIAAAQPAIAPLIRHGIFDPQDFAAESLSLITCFQTLEHVYDPMDMCRGAWRLLKGGGAVFFISHNRRALSAKLLGRKSPIFDIEHLQLFSPTSARAMLERAGFNRVTLRPVFNRYPLHYWLKLLPIPRVFKRRLIGIMKASGLGRLPVALPAGNMAVVAFKPG
jgi:SAM-dependent methyltransferase